MTIGNKLKLLRLENHYTQAGLARKIGIDRATICRYENDHRKPNTKLLSKIAKLYGMNLKSLLSYGEEEVTYSERDIFFSKRKILPVINQEKIKSRTNNFYLKQDIVDNIAVDIKSNALFGIRVTNDSWNPQIEKGDIVLVSYEEIDVKNYWFCFFLNTKIIGKIQRIKNGYLVYTEKDISSTGFITKLNWDYLSDKLLNITGIVKGEKKTI